MHTIFYNWKTVNGTLTRHSLSEILFDILLQATSAKLSYSRSWLSLLSGNKTLKTFLRKQIWNLLFSGKNAKCYAR